MPEFESDAAPAERPFQQFGGCLVLERQQVGERFDDGDVGAEGLPDTGELDPDDAAAEHDDRGWDPVQSQGVVAADDPVAVDGQARQRLGLGSGGEQDVSAGESCPST